ncbi:uncharacterized protein G2W53_012184 [Senna tora]|uniref:Uncharacterized protein n=1 Tax=Senna tora TaxID=362788 RepID=A0A834WRQ9_9FABA|nr:uncharacterized protein G2W53_012184 [Senna tora]
MAGRIYRDVAVGTCRPATAKRKGAESRSDDHIFPSSQGPLV